MAKAFGDVDEESDGIDEGPDGVVLEADGIGMGPDDVDTRSDEV